MITRVKNYSRRISFFNVEIHVSRFRDDFSMSGFLFLKFFDLKNLTKDSVRKVSMVKFVVKSFKIVISLLTDNKSRVKRQTSDLPKTVSSYSMIETVNHMRLEPEVDFRLILIRI